MSVIKIYLAVLSSKRNAIDVKHLVAALYSKSVARAQRFNGSETGVYILHEVCSRAELGFYLLSISYEEGDFSG